MILKKFVLESQALAVFGTDVLRLVGAAHGVLYELRKDVRFDGSKSVEALADALTKIDPPESLRHGGVPS